MIDIRLVQQRPSLFPSTDQTFSCVEDAEVSFNRHCVPLI